MKDNANMNLISRGIVFNLFKYVCTSLLDHLVLRQPPTGRYPGPAGDLKWATDSSSTKYTISNPASVPVSLQVHCIHLVYKNIISGGIVHVRNKYTK